MDYKTKQFKDLLDKSKNIVFMTGAGVSTYSGIPDYRSAGGIYTDNPEYMLSADCWNKEYIKFLQFINEHFNFSEYKPNEVHKWIAALEKDKQVTVVTQNIDGLHQKSGSTNVITYHGDINDWICEGCFSEYNFDIIKENNYCPKCKSKLKPNVVLYGQMIDNNKHNKAVEAITKADLIIVIGTSLTVQPFASLLEYSFPLIKSVLINKTETTNYFNLFNLTFLDDAIEIINKVNQYEL